MNSEGERQPQEGKQYINAQEPEGEQQPNSQQKHTRSEEAEQQLLEETYNVHVSIQDVEELSRWSRRELEEDRKEEGSKVYSGEWRVEVKKGKVYISTNNLCV